MRGLVVFLVSVLVIPSVWAGKGVGEDASYAREMGFEQRFFYGSGGNGDGQIEYICKAFPGTIGSDNTAAAVWQVQRFQYDSSARISTIAFAGDDDAFRFACDDRAALDYN